MERQAYLEALDWLSQRKAPYNREKHQAEAERAHDALLVLITLIDD